MALKVTRAQRVTEARVPLDGGQFRLFVYVDDVDGKEHLALVTGSIRGERSVLTRIHSECLTGDVLGSLRCDCGEQLRKSLALIAAEGRGVLLYLRQEGRGIGLIDKLRAYNLQDQGYDTVDANLKLGHPPDPRDYSVAQQMLADLGVDSVRLITNNPRKVRALQGLGIPVASRVPVAVPVSSENGRYLHTKVQRLEHLLDLDTSSGLHDELSSWLAGLPRPGERPLISFGYAQTLDGQFVAAEELAAPAGAQLWRTGMRLERLQSEGVSHVHVTGAAVADFWAQKLGDAALVRLVPRYAGQGEICGSPPRLLEPVWHTQADCMFLRARLDWC